VRKLVEVGRDSQRSPTSHFQRGRVRQGTDNHDDQRRPSADHRQGLHFYSFVPDSATTSNCNGQCATFWPPVKGPVTAGSGVTGTLGSITRSDGATQATYNRHPLYTYVGDTHPARATRITST